jgi:hypothetical protein
MVACCLQALPMLEKTVIAMTTPQNQKRRTSFEMLCLSRRHGRILNCMPVSQIRVRLHQMTMAQMKLSAMKKHECIMDQEVFRKLFI